MNSVHRPSISVLMAVHGGAEPRRFREVLTSLLEQSLPADQVVLVIDGFIPQGIEDLLVDYSDLLPLDLVRLTQNRGLGFALRTGLARCEHDLVARSDADDVSDSKRFEIQATFLEKHPEISAVGSWVYEAEEAAGSRPRERCLPTDPAELVIWARSRCPLNHMTVMFRRSAVLGVGGYADLRLAQDYDLWARMLGANHRLANIPEFLVEAGAAREMSTRRGGWKRVIADMTVQRQLVKSGVIGWPRAAMNMVIRTGVRLMPSRFRDTLYKRLWSSTTVGS